MKENEAIERLRNFETDGDRFGRISMDGRHKEIEMAISALEEIQQYRELGTVEELREAREKQRAKKSKFYAHNFYCSKCGNLVGNNEFDWKRFMYCDRCGQAIDWSE